MAEDAVVDLTDAVGPVLERVLPAVAANGEVDGRTYAVPNNQTQPVVLYHNAEVLEGLRLIREMVDAGAFGEHFTGTTADGSGDVSLVASGNAAFVLQGAWVYPDFLTEAPGLIANDGLGFTRFPVVEGGAGDPDNVVGNPANFWSVSAAADPEAQRVAIDFLVEQTYTEREVERFLVVRTVPPVRGLDRRLDDLENEDYLRFVHDMVASAPHFQLSWDQALPADQSGPLLDNPHRVFTGDLSPPGFVDAMNDTL